MAISIFDIPHHPTQGEVDNWRDIVSATLGNPVVARIRTTDATTTTLLRVTPKASSSVKAVAWVQAHRTGGSAGNPDDGAAYLIHSGWKVMTGTVSLLGATHTPQIAHEDQAAWQAEVQIVDNRPAVVVAGSANMDITWTGSLQLLEVVQ